MVSGKWVGMCGDDCDQWMDHRMVGFGFSLCRRRWRILCGGIFYLLRRIFGGSAGLGGVV